MMNAQETKAFAIEQDRLARIEEMVAEHGQDWADRFQPGTFGCHELLDRTSLAANLLDESILSHPSCLLNEEWYALAKQAASALNELYQKIGAAHLDDDQDRGRQRF
jgi:hypothetical protein